jgi:hypothetical protein
MAEMSLIQLVTEFCQRTSNPVPTVVAGTLDDTTLQIWKLLNEGIQDLSQRYQFPELTQKCLFNHLNGPDYQALDLTNETAVPGYKFMVPQTFWNNSSRLRMDDPCDYPTWQQVINMQITRALYSWTTFGTSLYIYPVPSPLPSVQFSFYYHSRFGVQSATAVPQLAYLADTDTPRLQSELILADLKWRWKRDKGFPYAEDQRTSEGQLVNLVGREPGQQLVLDNPYPNFGAFPALFIPPGSWPHP